MQLIFLAHSKEFGALFASLKLESFININSRRTFYHLIIDRTITHCKTNRNYDGLSQYLPSESSPVTKHIATNGARMQFFNYKSL